jgi:uncharacterized UBP type Zn finger protein
MLCLIFPILHIQMAMAWVFEHMEDPDFNDPPASSGAEGKAGVDNFNEGDVATLSSFGYTTKQAQGALKATDHNMERSRNRRMRCSVHSLLIPNANDIFL